MGAVVRINFRSPEASWTPNTGSRAGAQACWWPRRPLQKLDLRRCSVRLDACQNSIVCGLAGGRALAHRAPRRTVLRGRSSASRQKPSSRSPPPRSGNCGGSHKGFRLQASGFRSLLLKPGVFPCLGFTLFEYLSSQQARRRKTFARAYLAAHLRPRYRRGVASGESPALVRRRAR
jgi:hypothetical protein